MRFAEAIQYVLMHGCDLRRSSEPHIIYNLDAAEGVCFWSMNEETDELEEHSFNGLQIVSMDWQVRSPPYPGANLSWRESAGEDA